MADHSDALQMFRKSAIDCSVAYGIDIPTCIFFGITGVYRGARACGEILRRCGYPWWDQDVLLMVCLLIPLSLPSV